MGYRLAGYRMEGFCEIDPDMAEVYQRNMTVDHPYVMPISELNQSLYAGVPDWLQNIDVLDGSPPCSSFSMAGERENNWGKNMVFREGQAKQVLDDLFFDFIRTVSLVRPRVAIAENVKGLILGNAKKYAAEIFLRLREIGYDTQLFLLNAAHMGVPQRRERTFFISRRSDLDMGPVTLDFREPPISFSRATEGTSPDPSEIKKCQLTKQTLHWWKRTVPGASFSKAHPKGAWFSSFKVHPDGTPTTIVAAGGAARTFHHSEPRSLYTSEYQRLQSFPDDYDFNGMDAKYVCGMSVPPLMMQRVAGEVARALIKL